VEVDDGLALARQKMDAAKQRFTTAAQAVLDGDPEGSLLARLALGQVEEARAELRRLNEEADR
jgi:hypothetical protein